jgi:hypothetical protein
MQLLQRRLQLLKLVVSSEVTIAVVVVDRVGNVAVVVETVVAAVLRSVTLVNLNRRRLSFLALPV